MQRLPLKKLGTLQTGLAGTIKRLQSGGDKVSAIELSSITSDGLICWDELKDVRPEGKTDPYIVQSGDLVIGMRSPLRISYVSEAERTAVAIGTVVIFRANQQVSVAEYIEWLLQQRQIERAICKMTTGTSMLFLSKNDFRELEVPVPSIEIQRKIAKAWRLQKRLFELERKRMNTQEEYYRACGHQWMDCITDQAKNQEKVFQI